MASLLGSCARTPCRALRRRGSIAAPAHPCPHGHRGVGDTLGPCLSSPPPIVATADRWWAVDQSESVRLPCAPRALRGAEPLVGGLCPSARCGGVSATQRSTDFGPLGEPDAVPSVGGSGGCPPLVLSSSNALLRDGATALIHAEDLLASIGEGLLRSENSRDKHQRLMEAIG